MKNSNFTNLKCEKCNLRVVVFSIFFFFFRKTALNLIFFFCFFRSVVLALRKNYGNRKSTRNKCVEEGENNAEDGINAADKDDDKLATSSGGD